MRIYNSRAGSRSFRKLRPREIDREVYARHATRAGRPRLHAGLVIPLEVEMCICGNDARPIDAAVQQPSAFKQVAYANAARRSVQLATVALGRASNINGSKCRPR